MKVAGLSDVGRCREVNQDTFVVDEAMELYAVADGMGGHAAGEVASDLAIHAVAHSLRDQRSEESVWSPEQAGELLQQALREGNRKIVESVQARSEWTGMGTTLVAMVRTESEVVIAHVGDSRAYRLRSGQFSQLTSDHSLVNEQVKAGILTPEQAQRSPYRNIVTRALGNQQDVEVDVIRAPVEVGDIFVLCSDGLSGMLSDDQIRDVVESDGTTPQVACRKLVDLANENGGEDNITVIVAWAEI